MTINSVNNLNQSQYIKSLKNEDPKKEANEEKKDGLEIVDKFERSESKVNAEGTYKKPKFTPDKETIAKIKAETDRAHENLRNLVKKLLAKQGMTFRDLRIDGEDIKIDDETRAEAKRSLEEGGEYSVESVSDRLVDFAKAITGGDKSKISLMRESIEKGFKEAEKAFGGTLPDISYETLDRAMEKLDAWENEEA